MGRTTKTERERMAEHRERTVKSRTRKPTEKQQAFLDNFVAYSQQFDYQNYKEMVLTAFGDAGYDAANSNAYHRATEILKNNWNAVEQRIKIKLSNGALFAADMLIELATNAKQDSVRLKACIELLNKAGFQEVQQIEFSEKPVDQMTHEERQEEIKKLMEKHELRLVAGGGTSQNSEEV